jgi:hypothetical protein
MNPTLALILQILQTAALAAEGVTPGGLALTVEQDAVALLQIAQAAASAYQKVSGQPIDLNNLQPLPPV